VGRRVVRVWDTQSGTEVLTLDLTPDDELFALTFNQDDRCLIGGHPGSLSGANPGRIILWDAGLKEEVKAAMSP
jgi:WD40 repeat protein